MAVDDRGVELGDRDEPGFRGRSPHGSGKDRVLPDSVWHQGHRRPEYGQFSHHKRQGRSQPGDIRNVVVVGIGTNAEFAPVGDGYFLQKPAGPDRAGQAKFPGNEQPSRQQAPVIYRLDADVGKEGRRVPPFGFVLDPITVPCVVGGEPGRGYLAKFSNPGKVFGTGVYKDRPAGTVARSDQRDRRIIRPCPLGGLVEGGLKSPDQFLG